ncbi:MAG TPA: hypothetical protein VKU00_12965 [Chthonomonadaceae bacterium]|nr:hypothetical protein [Chthonomonadaceae bacterium]
MVFRKLFGRGEETSKERPGSVTIRVEFGGKSFAYTYDDLEMAQVRFPQVLADLNALYSRQIADEQE